MLRAKWLIGDQAKNSQSDEPTVDENVAGYIVGPSFFCERIFMDLFGSCSVDHLSEGKRRV